jgi:endonuclease YncB( thermonuclease family)
MRKIITFVLVLLAPCSVFATQATVAHIIDGDTFAATVKLEDDIKISVRVRILDIDAPELSGECDKEIKLAHRATNRLAELLPIGSAVELSGIKDDKYLGRIDAYVKNESGINVSKVMLKENLARPYSGGKRLSWCD